MRRSCGGCTHWSRCSAKRRCPCASRARQADRGATRDALSQRGSSTLTTALEDILSSGNELRDIPDDFAQALRALGLAGDEPLSGAPLEGGVSSDIWRIETASG